MKLPEPENEVQKFWYLVGYNKGMLDILEKWVTEKEVVDKEVAVDAAAYAKFAVGREDRIKKKMEELINQGTEKGEMMDDESKRLNI